MGDRRSSKPRRCRSRTGALLQQAPGAGRSGFLRIAACSATGNRCRGGMQGPSRRTCRSHRAAARAGGWRLLWERCVQRERRSGTRQHAGPIAAHAPLLPGFGKNPVVAAVVGALRAARQAIGLAAACRAHRGARAAPTTPSSSPDAAAVVGALREARPAIGRAAPPTLGRATRASTSEVTHSGPVPVARDQVRRL